jgi:transposase
MKGRYSGRTMTIYGSVLPGARSIALGAWRTDRLKNASLAARHFGIGRMTFYRWLKRFQRQGIVGFNEYSRRPRHMRTPVTPWTVAQRTVELRRQYPAWSKHKIQALLKKEGVVASVSTVGRILKRKVCKENEGCVAAQSQIPSRNEDS